MMARSTSEDFQFQFADYKHFVQQLDESCPEKEQLLEAIRDNQLLVDNLISDNVETQRLQTGKVHLLKDLIISQFLDKLIAAYSNPSNFPPEFDEGQRKTVLKKIEFDQTKATLNINRLGQNISSKELCTQLTSLTKHTYYQDAFSFTSPSDLGPIIEKICAYYRKHNQSPPYKFIVNSPSDDPNSRQTPDQICDQIAQNILNAAANSGFKPNEIEIVIDNVPYAISATTPGKETQYQSWIKTAEEKSKEFTKQERTTLSASPRI
jgi:hypothetical protein